jgi:hypothetical protein
MHSPAEIASNLPPLTAWMDAGPVLACHDTNDENEACIRAIVRVRSSRRVGSLFIAEIGR